jgi:hypothetical protein
MASDVAWGAITAGATAAVIGFPIAAIAAIALEIAGRRRPWVIAVTGLLMAWIVGFALLTSEDALGIRLVSIAIVRR